MTLNAALGNYNEIVFAQEALAWLRNNLGLAGRVHRDLESVRRAAGNKGETIQMRRPRKFTAAEFVPGTGTTANTLYGDNVEAKFTEHFEVKFTISDRELAYTRERMIDEHIGPAANAVAEAVENSLYDLARFTGGTTIMSGTPTIPQYFTKPRKTLVENLTPLQAANMHYMVDPTLAQLFLDDAIFHRADAVGGTGNQDALMAGNLGNRFGFNTFESQLAAETVPDLDGAPATVAIGRAAGDKTGAMDGAHAVNARSITVDGLTDNDTIINGRTKFTIAGDPTVYTAIAAAHDFETKDTVQATVASSEATFNIEPTLRMPAADNAVVTFKAYDAIQVAAAHTSNLVFHRDAFGLAFAPLPEIGDGMGARIATVSDPESGLSLRVRMYYTGDTTVVNVAIDALWARVVLEPMFATTVVRA